jgi:hypothetical protein
VRVGFAVVRVEPSSPAAFWDIARRAMADLAGTQSLNGIGASSYALHQTPEANPVRLWVLNPFFSEIRTDEATDQK